MARHLRVEFPGAIYHVSCRMLGTSRSVLFHDGKDRQRLIDGLEERVEQYNVRLYLFVLMTNHFHLVFETPGANCSKFMHSLLTAYSVYYNLRHGRHGHLLDGRFKAKLVEGDRYLLALTRYIHLNPVQVGAMKHRPIKEKIQALRQYEWSTYHSYIGKRKPLEFVEYGPILAQMDERKRQWPTHYRQFVESGLAGDDEQFQAALKESPRSIGSEEFRAWVEECYQALVDGRARPEDVSFRHTTEPLGPEEVLRILAEVFGVEVADFRRRQRHSPLRAVAARFMMKYPGCSQREVADILAAGSGSAISKQISRHEALLSTDKRLVRLLGRAEKQLGKRRQRRVSGAVKS